ncbi:hypothetical protein Q9233_002293 [Columba guinea]|nr:hypothetical protein Q9233_002293 [Columba guinea]
MVHCVLAILGEAGLSHVVFGLCTGQVRILEVDLILPIKSNHHLKVCSRYTKVKLSCLIVLKGFMMEEEKFWEREKDYCTFLAKPEVCLKPDCPVCLFAGLEQTGEQYGWMLELATAGIVTIILFTFYKICGNFQVLQELTHEEKMRELRKDMAGAGMLCTDGSEIALSQLVQPWTLDLEQPTRGSSSCNKC